MSASNERTAGVIAGARFISLEILKMVVEARRELGSYDGKTAEVLSVLETKIRAHQFNPAQV